MREGSLGLGSRLGLGADAPLGVLGALRRLRSQALGRNPQLLLGPATQPPPVLLELALGPLARRLGLRLRTLTRRLDLRRCLGGGGLDRRARPGLSLSRLALGRLRSALELEPR